MTTEKPDFTERIDAWLPAPGEPILGETVANTLKDVLMPAAAWSDRVFHGGKYGLSESKLPVERTVPNSIHPFPTNPADAAGLIANQQARDRLRGKQDFAQFIEKTELKNNIDTTNNPASAIANQKALDRIKSAEFHYPTDDIFVGNTENIFNAIGVVGRESVPLNAPPNTTKIDPLRHIPTDVSPTKTGTTDMVQYFNDYANQIVAPGVGIAPGSLTVTDPASLEPEIRRFEQSTTLPGQLPAGEKIVLNSEINNVLDKATEKWVGFSSPTLPEGTLTEQKIITKLNSMSNYLNTPDVLEGNVELTEEGLESIIELINAAPALPEEYHEPIRDFFDAWKKAYETPDSSIYPSTSLFQGVLSNAWQGISSTWSFIKKVESYADPLVPYITKIEPNHALLAWNYRQHNEGQSPETMADLRGALLEAILKSEYVRKGARGIDPSGTYFTEGGGYGVPQREMNEFEAWISKTIGGEADLVQASSLFPLLGAARLANKGVNWLGAEGISQMTSPVSLALNIAFGVAGAAPNIARLLASNSRFARIIGRMIQPVIAGQGFAGRVGTEFALEAGFLIPAGALEQNKEHLPEWATGTPAKIVTGFGGALTVAGAIAGINQIRNLARSVERTGIAGARTTEQLKHVADPNNVADMKFLSQQLKLGEIVDMTDQEIVGANASAIVKNMGGPDWTKNLRQIFRDRQASNFSLVFRSMAERMVTLKFIKEPLEELRRYNINAELAEIRFQRTGKREPIGKPLISLRERGRFLLYASDLGTSVINIKNNRDWVKATMGAYRLPTHLHNVNMEKMLTNYAKILSKHIARIVPGVREDEAISLIFRQYRHPRAWVRRADQELWESTAGLGRDTIAQQTSILPDRPSGKRFPIYKASTDPIRKPTYDELLTEAFYKMGVHASYITTNLNTIGDLILDAAGNVISPIGRKALKTGKGNVYAALDTMFHETAHVYQSLLRAVMPKEELRALEIAIAKWFAEGGGLTSKIIDANPGWARNNPGMSASRWVRENFIDNGKWAEDFNLRNMATDEGFAELMARGVTRPQDVIDMNDPAQRELIRGATQFFEDMAEMMTVNGKKLRGWKIFSGYLDDTMPLPEEGKNAVRKWMSGQMSAHLEGSTKFNFLDPHITTAVPDMPIAAARKLGTLDILPDEELAKLLADAQASQLTRLPQIARTGNWQNYFSAQELAAQAKFGFANDVGITKDMQELVTELLEKQWELLGESPGGIGSAGAKLTRTFQDLIIGNKLTETPAVKTRKTTLRNDGQAVSDAKAFIRSMLDYSGMDWKNDTRIKDIGDDYVLNSPEGRRGDPSQVELRMFLERMKLTGIGKNFDFDEFAGKIENLEDALSRKDPFVHGNVPTRRGDNEYNYNVMVDAYKYLDDIDRGAIVPGNTGAPIVLENGTYHRTGGLKQEWENLIQETGGLTPEDANEVLRYIFRTGKVDELFNTLIASRSRRPDGTFRNYWDNSTLDEKTTFSQTDEAMINQGVANGLPTTWFWHGSRFDVPKPSIDFARYSLTGPTLHGTENPNLAAQYAYIEGLISGDDIPFRSLHWLKVVGNWMDGDIPIKKALTASDASDLNFPIHNYIEMKRTEMNEGLRLFEERVKNIEEMGWDFKHYFSDEFNEIFRGPEGDIGFATRFGGEPTAFDYWRLIDSQMKLETYQYNWNKIDYEINQLEDFLRGTLDSLGRIEPDDISRLIGGKINVGTVDETVVPSMLTKFEMQKASMQDLITHIHGSQGIMGGWMKPRGVEGSDHIIGLGGLQDALTILRNYSNDTVGIGKIYRPAARDILDGTESSVLANAYASPNIHQRPKLPLPESIKSNGKIGNKGAEYKVRQDGYSMAPDDLLGHYSKEAKFFQTQMREFTDRNMEQNGNMVGYTFTGGGAGGVGHTNIPGRNYSLVASTNERLDAVAFSPDNAASVRISQETGKPEIQPGIERGAKTYQGFLIDNPYEFEIGFRGRSRPLNPDGNDIVFRDARAREVNQEALDNIFTRKKGETGEISPDDIAGLTPPTDDGVQLAFQLEGIKKAVKTLKSTPKKSSNKASIIHGPKGNIPEGKSQVKIGTHIEIVDRKVAEILEQPGAINPDGTISRTASVQIVNNYKARMKKILSDHRKIRMMRREEISKIWRQAAAIGGRWTRRGDFRSGIEAMRSKESEVKKWIIEAAPISKIEFEEMLKQAERYWEETPGPHIFTKQRAVEGLEKLFGMSAIPRKFGKLTSSEMLDSSELDALIPVFGVDVINEIGRAQIQGWGHLKNLIIDILNLPRAVLSSFDFSAPFRQGFMLVGHPKEFFRSMGPMIRAAYSEGNATRIMRSMQEHPLYAYFRKNGLYIATDSITEREEAFISRGLFKWFPVGKIWQWSQQAHTTYLNKLRWDIMLNTYNDWVRTGVLKEGTEEMSMNVQYLAKFLNHASGRGDLGTIAGFDVNNAAPYLSMVFFSPRLLVSRFQAPLDLFTANNAGATFARKIIAKDLASATGTAVGIMSLMALAGATINLDPRSADFGKGKWGPTRIDFTAGYSNLISNGYRMASGESLTASGDAVPVYGGRKNHFIRYWRNKLSPQAALAVDMMRGKNFYGQDMPADTATLRREGFQRFTPMAIQEIYEAFKEQWKTGENAWLGSFALIGAGSNSYHTKEDLAKALYGRGYNQLWDFERKTLSEAYQLAGNYQPSKDDASRAWIRTKQYEEMANTVRKYENDIKAGKSKKITERNMINAFFKAKATYWSQMELLNKDYDFENGGIYFVTPNEDISMTIGLKAYHILLNEISEQEKTAKGFLEETLWERMEKEILPTLNQEQRQYLFANINMEMIPEQLMRHTELYEKIKSMARTSESLAARDIIDLKHQRDYPEGSYPEDVPERYGFPQEQRTLRQPTAETRYENLQTIATR